MYKNQLQELAQRSCFNLPAYSCIREGPDHAPRFKATVNFNGETFESPTFCSTLRQAEHAAAEVALNTLAIRGPSRALAARVLDETGVYKNLLQETAHRAGLKLPVYTTVRSGPGHVPIFKCTVELAGMSFAGEPARTKKQAQKNAAMAAWFALKRLVQHGSSASTSIVSQHGSSLSSASSSLETRRGNEEQEQVIIARFLTSTQPSELKNKQVVSQQIRERFIPVCRELTSSTSNFYPTQCQSWAYPSFSPEMALCHMWQQEQLLHLQPRLLTVQVPPPPFPGPQCLPYMHAILSPDTLFVPTREPEPSPAGPRITITTTRPSLYFSDHLVSDPIGGKSAVTIQEIHEEKPEEFSDCLCPDSILLANINAEPRLKELVPEDDKQMNGEQESKAQNLQRTKNHFGQFENPLSSSRDDGYTAADYRAQNPCGFDASPSYVQCPPRPSPSRSFRPPSVACPVTIRSMRPIPLSAPSPVMVRNVGPVSTLPRPQDSTPHIHVPPRIRTGIPSHSAGTYPQRMDVGGVHPRFLAPAVRIRSVIPVCAAPQRKNSVPCQEGVLAPRDQADTVPEDIATTGSEFYRLKIQDENRY